MLLGTIRARQLSCLGHVVREGGLEKICLEGMIQGKKDRGRQRINFLDSLLKDLGDNTKPHELLREADNRERWRSMVNNVEDMAHR